ncbi:ankyrin repeat-containing domain protein [Neocallimastix lanati (nom. inval.)]|nr:ankyrin repeat-containing domain protein [Neocallimastix sp. JGI-2020a]
MEKSTDSFIKAIDSSNINKIKSLAKNNNNDKNKRDIVSEIYIENKLTPERLKYIIEINIKELYISSFLIKELINKDEFELLELIFNNLKFYNNEFMKWLLHQYKNKTPISLMDLNQEISNEKFKISTDIYDYNSSITYLNEAIKVGNKHIIHYLIEHVVDINKENVDGESPIFFGLEEHGVDITKEDRDGGTPLFDACYDGNKELVQYLVEELRADINKEVEDGFTPLFCACQSGNNNLVKYLVEELGADINKEDRDGRTPLFDACYKNTLSMLY